MKNQKHNLLKFEKKSLMELNNDDLQNINGGDPKDNSPWPPDRSMTGTSDIIIDE